MKIIAAIFTSLFFSVHAYAFSIEEDNPFAAPPGYEPLKVEAGALSWEVFDTTKNIMTCKEDEEIGYEICEVTPEYSEEIKTYDSKEITIMGFMWPLTDSMDGQTNFLLGAYPLSCPFEYHAPPSQIVEVFSKTPVHFSFDPVTVTGKFEVRYNKETGVFYYLYGE